MLHGCGALTFVDKQPPQFEMRLHMAGVGLYHGQEVWHCLFGLVLLHESSRKTEVGFDQRVVIPQGCTKGIQRRQSIATAQVEGAEIEVHNRDRLVVALSCVASLR